MIIPDPVDLASISDHFDKQKTAAMLLVMCGDELLLQTIEHEGSLVCDAFGTFVGDDDVNLRLTELQKEHFGSSYPQHSAGKVIMYINKPQPDGRVQLSVDTYIVELSQEQKTNLSLKQNQFWINAETIKQNSRIREDDKLLFTKALTDHTLDIVMDVDQLGLWIDAKLLAWANLAKK